MEKKSFFSLINKRVFFPPAIVLLILIVIGAVWPTQFGNGCSACLSFITEQFGWLFTLGAAILLIFCFWAGFSKYGKIKLGGPKAKPTMTRFQWFAVSFTSSLAIGVSYWCVAEPMTHFMNPPTFLGIEGGTAEAAQSAIVYSYLHWAFVPFGIYVSAGVAIAFMFYNAKRAFKVSSALYPILGDRCDGPIGNGVDSLAIFAMVGGIATSLGLGCMQLQGGLDYVFGIKGGTLTLTIMIVIMTAFYTIIATTGIHKGIKHVGTINMYLYFALFAFIFLVGPTRSIIENTLTSLGDYIFQFVPLTLNCDPVQQTGWPEAWTTFYWAWWLAFAPLTGLFMVRLAKGRTVREFVTVNLIAPAAFIIIWFGTWGTTGIFSDLFNGTDIGEKISELGSQYAVFELLQHYPMVGITSVLFLILVFLNFNTQAEAVSYTLSSMTTVGFDKEGNEKEPPKQMTVFWGVVMGILTIILLYTGGSNAFSNLQTSVVICGLPIIFLQVIMAFSYYKGMKNAINLDKVGTFDDPQYKFIVEGQTKTENSSVSESQDTK